MTLNTIFSVVPIIECKDKYVKIDHIIGNYGHG